MIFYDQGSSDWTLTHSLFRPAGLVPNVALEVDSIETAKRMVERGLGLSFLPQIAVGSEFYPQTHDRETPGRRTAAAKPGRDPSPPSPAKNRSSGLPANGP